MLARFVSAAPQRWLRVPGSTPERGARPVSAQRFVLRLRRAARGTARSRPSQQGLALPSQRRPVRAAPGLVGSEGAPRAGRGWRKRGGASRTPEASVPASEGTGLCGSRTGAQAGSSRGAQRAPAGRLGPPRRARPGRRGSGRASARLPKGGSGRPSCTRRSPASDPGSSERGDKCLRGLAGERERTAGENCLPEQRRAASPPPRDDPENESPRRSARHTRTTSTVVTLRCGRTRRRTAGSVRHRPVGRALGLAGRTWFQVRDRVSPRTQGGKKGLDDAHGSPERATPGAGGPQASRGIQVRIQVRGKHAWAPAGDRDLALSPPAGRSGVPEP